MQSPGQRPRFPRAAGFLRVGVRELREHFGHRLTLELRLNRAFFHPQIFQLLDGELGRGIEYAIKVPMWKCLDPILPLGERDLRRAVQESTEPDPVERNHPGRGNEWMETPCEEPNMHGAVECQARLGGVLESDRRPA